MERASRLIVRVGVGWRKHLRTLCLDPKWEPLRKLFYEQDAQIRGGSNASGFMGSSYNIKWGLVNTWLNGYTVMGDRVFDKWLVALLDMLAKLLAKHPKWG